MPETKTNRLEMQKCLERIARKHYTYPDDFNSEQVIWNDPDFIRLQAIANQEVHPSGDQSLLSNASSLSWERLISMREEAQSRTDFSFSCSINQALKLIDAEIERRLLALLDKSNN